MDVDIKEKKIVDGLTSISVSILTRNFVLIDGVEKQIGENHRCAYINSASDRERLMANEPEKVVETVLSVWGDEPTVEEPEIPVYAPTPTKEELLEKRIEILEKENDDRIECEAEIFYELSLLQIGLV